MTPDREALYASLKAKLMQGDPLAASMNKEVGDEARSHAFLASLQQGANQMGSLGGAVVKNNPVASMASTLAAGNQADLGARQDDVAKKNRVREYLLGQMDKNENVSKQLAQRQAEREAELANRNKLAEENRAFRKEELGQRERLANNENTARLELEKLRGTNALAEAGQKAKTLATPAASKSDQEANYRFISLKNNAQQLKDLIEKEGTASFTGSAGSQMDSKIYQMAVDFAKLVDPDSVAREGEVAAAQKYMLPFRDNGGLTTRNNTAKMQIDNYMKDLDSRLAARNAAKTGDTDAITYKKPAPSGESGTAYAGPAAIPAVNPGQEEDGYVFKGGDPSDPKNWEKR